MMPFIFAGDSLETRTYTCQGSGSIDVELEAEGPVGHLGCGFWSEDSGDWRTDGMVLGAIETAQDGEATLVECDTFHLSAFTSRQDATTPQWSTVDLLEDFSILSKVRRGKTTSTP